MAEVEKKQSGGTGKDAKESKELVSKAEAQEIARTSAKEVVKEAKEEDDDDVVHRSFRVTKKVGGQVHGFMDFIREQGVIGLAVGLTIGTAVTVFVKSIVDNILNPVIGAFLPGGADLNTKYKCLKMVGTTCTNKLSYGIVLSNLINFLAIAAIIYFVVKGLKLDKLDKKKEG
jgi:large conductance mechanosensitive channel